ncbi:hypothetical protein EON76_00105 [bacterium]|nr:MAG: hypothetical protein EON76_00105 [bacterium]
MANIDFDWADAQKTAEEKQKAEFKDKMGSLLRSMTQTLKNPLVNEPFAMQILDGWNYLASLVPAQQLAIIAGNGAPTPQQHQQPQGALGSSHPGQPGGQPHSPQVDQENAELKDLLRWVLQEAGVVDGGALANSIRPEYVVQAVTTAKENARIAAFNEGKEEGLKTAPAAAASSKSISIAKIKKALKPYSDTITKVDTGVIEKTKSNGMKFWSRTDVQLEAGAKAADDVLKLIEGDESDD